MIRNDWSQSPSNNKPCKHDYSVRYSRNTYYPYHPLPMTRNSYHQQPTSYHYNNHCSSHGLSFPQSDHSTTPYTNTHFLKEDDRNFHPQEHIGMARSSQMISNTQFPQDYSRENIVATQCVKIYLYRLFQSLGQKETRTIMLMIIRKYRLII